MAVVTVESRGNFAHNHTVRAKSKQRQFSRQQLQVGMTRSHMIQSFPHYLNEQACQPTITAPTVRRSSRTYPRSSADSTPRGDTGTTYTEMVRKPRNKSKSIRGSACQTAGGTPTDEEHTDPSIVESTQMRV